MKNENPNDKSIHRFRKGLKFKNIDDDSVNKKIYVNKIILLKYAYVVQNENTTPCKTSSILNFFIPIYTSYHAYPIEIRGTIVNISYRSDGTR